MIKNPVDTALEKHLDYLKLPFLKENCRPFAAEGNAKHWSHLDYLARLIEGEAAARQDRIILRRIKEARFPVIKTLDTFRWDWPKKINQLQIQDLFRSANWELAGECCGADGKELRDAARKAKLAD